MTTPLHDVPLPKSHIMADLWRNPSKLKNSLLPGTSTTFQTSDAPHYRKLQLCNVLTSSVEGDPGNTLH